MSGFDFGSDEVVANEFGFFTDEIAAKKFVRYLNTKRLEKNKDDMTNFAYGEDENGNELFFEENEVEPFLDFLENREMSTWGYYRYMELELNQ